MYDHEGVLIPKDAKAKARVGSLFDFNGNTVRPTILKLLADTVIKPKLFNAPQPSEEVVKELVAAVDGVIDKLEQQSKFSFNVIQRIMYNNCPDMIFSFS